MEEKKLAPPQNLPKNLKNSKLPLVFLCLVILILVGEGGYYWKLKKTKKQTSPQGTLPSIQPTKGTKVFLPSPVSLPVDSFPALASPVEKDNLLKGKIVQLDYKVDDLAFSLSVGDSIYAAFPGRVELAGGADSPQKIMILKGDHGELTLKYLFSGTSVVKNGQTVKKSDLLANVGKDFLPTRNVNLIIQALWQGKRVSVSKNTFISP